MAFPVTGRVLLPLPLCSSCDHPFIEHYLYARHYSRCGDRAVAKRDKSLYSHRADIVVRVDRQVTQM